MLPEPPLLLGRQFAGGLDRGRVLDLLLLVRHAGLVVADDLGVADRHEASTSGRTARSSPSRLGLAGLAIEEDVLDGPDLVAVGIHDLHAAPVFTSFRVCISPPLWIASSGGRPSVASGKAIVSAHRGSRARRCQMRRSADTQTARNSGRRGGEEADLGRPGRRGRSRRQSQCGTPLSAALSGMPCAVTSGSRDRRISAARSASSSSTTTS